MKLIRFLLILPLLICMYIYGQTHNKILGYTSMWYILLAKYLEDKYAKKTPKLSEYLALVALCIIYVIMVYNGLM